MAQSFEEAYIKLNPAQKDAVSSTEGPVMVIAGPGTGKTQILALRIGNILKQTDIPASGILCLTYTRSAVHAMRDRLEHYIGERAGDVAVSTFHSFVISLIEKYYVQLGFDRAPTLLDEREAVFLADALLHNREWKYLRPRANPSAYFSDIRNLISLLKRERMTPQEFKKEIDAEIQSLKDDPASTSSRGATKGALKKEVEKSIEALLRTGEVVDFYDAYEERKKFDGLMDYDDVLEYGVTLVEQSDEARADLQEEYQYILVDEHQDSSGVQNKFLKAVWGDVEKPNIFVVGDDRQLIYGFGGASLSYFEEFKTAFGRAKLITLVENYRSTAPILDLADTLLSSTLTTDTLRSNTQKLGEIILAEYAYPRDEIIAAGLYFKKQITQGVSPEECVLLVPKNYQVRSALAILRGLGLPVSGGESASFFESREWLSFKKILQIVANPNNTVALTEILLDPLSEIPVLQAHTFLRGVKARDLQITDLIQYDGHRGLFQDTHPIARFGKKLALYIEHAHTMGVLSLISMIGNDVFITNAKGHEQLIERAEVVRTLFHLLEVQQKTKPIESLSEFLEYIERLEKYRTHIPLAVFGSHKGIGVMTLHKSKGLEFENVWIAHLNEETFMSGKRGGFTLPEMLSEKVEKKDLAVAKRELYVALTRAKINCTLSYAHNEYRGGELSLAKVIAGLPAVHFTKKEVTETEAELLSHGPTVYIKNEVLPQGDDIEKIKALVTEMYGETRVSVSLLNNFFECPWKWYFRNFLQLPEVKTDSLALGSAVHSAIELVLKAGKIPNQSAIQKCIEDSFAREGVLDIRTLPKLISEAIAITNKWIESSYTDLAKNHESERSVSYKDPQFPGLNFYGKIDLTERFSSSEITVTDFKTGSPKTPNTIEKRDEEGRLSTYMRQLAMYSYLLTGVEKKEVTTSRLHFLEAKAGDKNMLYATHIGNEELDLLIRDIREYDTSFKSGTWISRPCHFKAYGSGNETCLYCELSKQLGR